MVRYVSIHLRAACMLVPGFVIAGCEPAAESPLQPGDIPVQASYTPESVDVIAFSDGAVVGSSQLVRTPNGVNYRVKTSGLVPGNAYTLWIVIFNNPAGCIDGCDGDDLGVPAAEPDMMYAAGHVVGSSGKATFSGRRHVGDDRGSVNAPVGMPAYGLTDPSGAVIWFFVHHHGSVLPSHMPDMIHTMDGGCTDAGVPAAGVASPYNGHEYGKRGPNTCQTVQGAFH